MRQKDKSEAKRNALILLNGFMRLCLFVFKGLRYIANVLIIGSEKLRNAIKKEVN